MISKCPRCNHVEFEKLDILGVNVDRCTHCMGIWLDEGEYEKIIETSHQNDGQELPPIEELRSESYKPLRVLCPNCQLILLEPEAVHFEFIHHYVAIDRCKHCNGVWLDDSELALLFNFIKKEETKAEQLGNREIKSLDQELSEQIYTGQKSISRRDFFRFLKKEYRITS